MSTQLNFSNPLQGRRWLKLLRHDPQFGIRIIPQLRLKKRALGFSFSSNALGLRGPANTRARGVILGTSYAMGFAVDSGLNWYEQDLADADWLNLGLPVGIHQMEALLQLLYKGEGKTAVFLYHPNLWPMTKSFGPTVQNEPDIFARMHWNTSLGACLALGVRKHFKDRSSLRTGSALRIRHGAECYHIDCMYARCYCSPDQAFVRNAAEALVRIARRFERLLVIRVPIKQELVPATLVNSHLRNTHDSYDRGWKLFAETLRPLATTSFYNARMAFELSDYHPRDTHWNVSGNRKFACYVSRILAGHNLASVPENTDFAASYGVSLSKASGDLGIRRCA